MNVKITLDIDSTMLPEISALLNPAPVTTAPAPVTSAPVIPAPVNPTSGNQAPIAAVPDPVPTSPTPLYTVNDLANAGAALAQAGRIPELQALLAKYNARSIMALPPESYAAFAADLKAMGARL